MSEGHFELLEETKSQRCFSKNWRFTQGAIFGLLVCGGFLAVGWLLGYDVAHPSQAVSQQKLEGAPVWPLCNMNGVWTQDTNRCECYQCITGTNCTSKTAEASCRVTATSGQPYLMQEWWNNFTQGSAPDYYGTPLNWRVPYQNPIQYGNVQPSDTGLDAMLNRAIRGLHAKYKNVVIDPTDTIIISTGATQFWSAAMWAYAKVAADNGNNNLPFYVFERTPYYFGHPDMVDSGTMAEVLNPNLVQWNAATNLAPNRVIEILTCPSNPLGDYYTPRYPNAFAKIHDLVYYWPHLSNGMTTPYNEQVMFFSLTKLSGHAATRFGWAIVKDPAVANMITSYISNNNQGPSVDIKWRSLSIMNTIATTNYVEEMAEIMKLRWVRIMNWFNSGQTRFRLLSEPNTAYIYAQCLLASDTNCATVFTNVGIDGWSGTRFGDTNNKYRINLTLHSYAFDLLMAKLARLTTFSDEALKEIYSQLPPEPKQPEKVFSEYMDDTMQFDNSA